jgi:hypothetical protein
MSWAQEWGSARLDVLERDRYRCQAIGPNGERCPAEGASLHVHHIASVIRDGGDPLDLSNLVALCSRCHPSVEAGRRTFIPPAPEPDAPASVWRSYVAAKRRAMEATCPAA